MIDSLAMIKKIHQGADATCFASILYSWKAHPDQKLQSQKQKRDQVFIEKYASDMLDKSLSDKVMPIPEFLEKCEQMINCDKECTDCYFSVNSFYKRKRRSRAVRHLNCFVLDFDFYKIKEYSDLSPAQFFKKIKRYLPGEPTIVMDTGRGLDVIYCFKHCSYHMSDLYKQINKQFHKRLERYGVDDKASLITQVIRMPGTVNSKTGTFTEILEINDTSYVIQDFTYLLPYSAERTAAFKAEKKKKYKGDMNPAQVKQCRDPIFKKIYADFSKLIILRNRTGNYEGYRETMLYMLRGYATWSGYSINESVQFALKLNSEFHSPLSDREVEVQCRPADGLKKCSIDTIVDKLQITIAEQKKLKVLKRQWLKKKEYAAFKRKHPLLNRTQKEIEQLERRTWIWKHLIDGITRTEMSKRLNVDKGTVTRDINYIRSHPAEFHTTLKEYMEEIKEALEDVIFLRKTLYKRQQHLSEWLKMADTALEYLVRTLGVAEN